MNKRDFILSETEAERAAYATAQRNFRVACQYRDECLNGGTYASLVRASDMVSDTQAVMISKDRALTKAFEAAAERFEAFDPFTA